MASTRRSGPALSAARNLKPEPVPAPANDSGSAPAASNDGVRSDASVYGGPRAQAANHDQPGSIMSHKNLTPERAHLPAAEVSTSIVVAFLQTLLNAAKATEPAPAPPAPAAPSFLTVAEFAEHLHVGEKTVRRMVADGMPHERPRPRLVRIPLAKAQAWIAAQTDKASIAYAQERATVDARRGDPH